MLYFVIYLMNGWEKKLHMYEELMTNPYFPWGANILSSVSLMWAAQFFQNRNVSVVSTDVAMAKSERQNTRSINIIEFLLDLL